MSKKQFNFQLHKDTKKVTSDLFEGDGNLLDAKFKNLTAEDLQNLKQTIDLILELMKKMES